MYQGQYVFGYDTCRIAYIIEGKVKRHLVSNGFVGNARHKVSKERFEREVAHLEDEGFEVMRTCSVENSMFELAKWAESVARDVRSGRLPLTFTYNEFVEEVSKIPKEIDFSRLAKDHMEQRKHMRRDQEAQEASASASVTVDLVSDGESDGGDMRPIVLDEVLRTTGTMPVEVRSNVSASARKRFRLDGDPRNEARTRSIEGAGYPAAIAVVVACSAGRATGTTVRPPNVDGGGTERSQERICQMDGHLPEGEVCRARVEKGRLKGRTDREVAGSDQPPASRISLAPGEGSLRAGQARCRFDRDPGRHPGLARFGPSGHRIVRGSHQGRNLRAGRSNMIAWRAQYPTQTYYR